MTIDTHRITAYGFWRDAPMLADVLTRKVAPTVEDDRLTNRGAVGALKGALGRASARRKGRALVEALFRQGRSPLNLATTPMTMILEEEEVNLLILPSSNRVIWFNGFEHFDAPGVTVWSAGYLSSQEWMWSDLNRIEHIRDATIGNDRFMNGALAPGHIRLAEEAGERLRAA